MQVNTPYESAVIEQEERQSGGHPNPEGETGHPGKEAAQELWRGRADTWGRLSLSLPPSRPHSSGAWGHCYSRVMYESMIIQC